MPRGIYNRDKPKTVGKPPKDAIAPPVAAMPIKLAIVGFKEQALSWHRAGINMVASATVCLLVGSYSKQKIDYDTTIIRLKGEVAETGIKEAQIYKYVGLAKALAGRVLTMDLDLVEKVVKSKAHDPAMRALVEWLEKQQVRTLDGVAVLLGKYQRSETPTPATPTTATAETSPTLAPGATGPIETITPTKAEPAAILARINREPEILNALPAATVVSNYIKAGHKPEELLEALIPYLSSVRTCNKVITRLTKRAEALREKEPA